MNLIKEISIGEMLVFISTLVISIVAILSPLLYDLRKNRRKKVDFLKENIREIINDFNNFNIDLISQKRKINYSTYVSEIIKTDMKITNMIHKYNEELNWFIYDKNGERFINIMSYLLIDIKMIEELNLKQISHFFDKTLSLSYGTIVFSKFEIQLRQ
ncbi:hypothetical protein [Mesoplasma florum]|uniref:hypothetical protein n=1 Tax=Mesoplasma florum TaxID=2151 RepID=UPI000BE45F19|nr:hypothetical protein [Mesoplasma florum]ATI73384.1 hypothetical protein CQZ69_02320 [Mesoplasma florum]AVN61783.1 hypothetical protein CG004_02320 [Mesoplasma florum]